VIKICITVVEYASYHVAPAVWFVLNRMWFSHSFTHSLTRSLAPRALHIRRCMDG